MINIDGLIDQETGAQRRLIYADQAIYEQELERIFGRCWLFLAHESQVPNPGDFFRTYMGEDEVVVVRQDDRSIKVFLNTCTHRGNRLTRADRGNTRAFSCNYHGWAFGIDGSLATVPLESEVYFNEIDKNQFRLVPVEQVDSYHGLIFGCFDKDAPSLADYLGDMRWYLDVALDAMPGGTELLGATQKVVIHSNWKLSVENVCGDGYHLGWSHGGALKATQSGDFSGFTVGNSSVDLEGGMSVAGLNGNSVLATLDGVSGYAFYPNPTLALKYLNENRAKAVARLGKFRGEKLWGSQLNLTVFPSLQFLPGLNWFRVYHPKGPGKIEMWTWAIAEKAMPDELKQQILDNELLTFGPAGLFDNDDGDNLSACTVQSRGWRTRQMPVYTNMALGRSGKRVGLPGDIASGVVSEHNQRYFYRRWQEHMQAKDWSEVPQYNLNSLEANDEQRAVQTA